MSITIDPLVLVLPLSLAGRFLRGLYDIKDLRTAIPIKSLPRFYPPVAYQDLGV